MNTPKTPSGNLEVLAHPTFKRLCLAMLFANFADSLLFVTAAIWVKELTGSDQSAGLVFVFLTLPALIAPLNGVIADRYNRKTVLIVNYLGTALVCTLCCFVEGPDDVWLIYVAIFLYSNANYLNGAAQSGLLHSVLPEKMLPAANGMLSSLDQGLRIIAPPCGAVLLTTYGIDTVIAVTCGSFLVTAGLLCLVPTAPPKDRQSSRPPTSQPALLIAELGTGCRFIAGHRALRMATLAITLGFGAVTTLNVTNFAALEHGSHSSTSALSVLVSIQGVCSVMAGLAVGWVISKLGFAGTSMAGALLASMGIAATAGESFWILIVAMVLVGCGVPLLVVAYLAYLQSVTPNELQGRVSTISILVATAPQSLAAWAATAVIANIDYRWIIASAATVCLGSILPSLRQHRSGPIDSTRQELKG